MLLEERTRSEEIIFQSKQDWEDIFNALTDIITIHDSEFNIIRANKAAEKILGLSFLDSTRMKCYRHYHGKESPPEGCPSCRCSKTGTPAISEIFEPHLNMFIEIRAIPRFDSNKRLIGLIHIGRDITERKKLEEQVDKEKKLLEQKNRELEEAYAELKAAQSHLLQQEKMASIGQLAAGVAHEINNPTGFIMSNLGSLQKYADRLSEFIAAQSEALEESSAPVEGGNGNLLARIKELRKSLKIDYIMEDTKSLIRESIDGTERIKRIVQDLKSFSHAGDSELKMADINTGLESTINIVWNELKYKATVKKEYGDIPKTQCNPGQLNQVFMNMLVNAAHAIEKQGEIIVRTWHEDGQICVSISDTGCGIPEDKLGRIFEPFFTTKEVGKGTGLGLSIAYDIVKKHNGEIKVESEAGRGSTFTIKTPVVGR
jgi:two-component system NtrC family sensor kinase